MTQNKKTIFVVCLLYALGMASCSGPGGSSGGSSSSDVTDNLQTVRDGMVPASLNYEQNSASINPAEGLILHARQVRSDPCDAVDGDLFACQPVLLQLYMDLAQDFLDIVLDIVTHTNSGIGEAPDGASGSFETEDGITVAYNKTSATDYSLLLTVDDESVGYIDVNSTQYTLQMDLTAFDQAGDEAPETMEIVVNYTDDNTWDMVAFMTGMPCDDDDTRKPERFRLIIDKVSGLWTGKTMFYNGVWLYGLAEGTEGDPTCETEASDELAISFYTDFVSNDMAAKASVYLMPRTLDTLDSIADYGMDSLDENFGADFDTSEYANPFCTETGTLIATWSDDCSAVDATIGSAEYGPASDWVIPSEFYLQGIELPESL